MDNTNTTFAPGDTAILRVAPHPSYLKYRGKTCRVTNIYPYAGNPRRLQCEVRFDNGTETGLTVKVWPDQLLASPPEVGVEPGVQMPKAKRRGVLHLHNPADTRSEAERIEEARVWFNKGDGARDGFGMMLVGQGRAAAICHACSRESRKKGGPSMVQIRCVKCKSLGYSPSTNSTEGVPDSIIYRLCWPVATSLLVEWKDGPKGQRTKEQKSLEVAGRLVVAWDLPSCLLHVYEFERAILRDESACSTVVTEYLRTHNLLSEADEGDTR